MNTLIQDSRLPSNSKLYKKKLEWMMDNYTTEKEIVVDNNKEIHSLDFKNGILALSLKIGRVLIYKISDSKEIKFFQKIIFNQNEILKEMNLTRRNVRLSEYGKFLFTGSVESSLIIFKLNPVSKKFEKIFEVAKTENSRLTAMDWNEKDELLATGGVFTDLNIWRLDSFSNMIEKTQTIKGKIRIYQQVLFSENNKFLVADGETFEKQRQIVIYLKEINDNYKLIKTLNFQRKKIRIGKNMITMSSDGKILFIATENSEIMVYRITEKFNDFALSQIIKIKSIYKYPIIATTIEYVDEFKSLIAYCNNGIMKVFAFENGKFLKEKNFKIHEHQVNDSTFCRRTGFLISGSKFGIVKVKNIKDLDKDEWNLKSYLRISQVETGYKIHSKINSCEFSDDLNTIAFCDSNGEFRIISRDEKGSYQLAREFTVSGVQYNSQYPMDVSYNGEYLVYGVGSKIFGEKRSSKSLGMRGEKIVFKPIGDVEADEKKGLRSIKFFSKIAYRLVTGGNDWKMKIWDIANEKFQIVKVLKGHSRPVHCLFVPDSDDFITSVGQDKSVRIWEKKEGNFEAKKIFYTELRSVSCTVVSKLKDIVILGAKGEIHLYKWIKKKSQYVRTSAQKLSENSLARVVYLSLSPSEDHLMILDSDGRVKVWLIARDYLVPSKNFTDVVEFAVMNKKWNISLILGLPSEMFILPLVQKQDIQNSFNEMGYYKKLFADEKYFMSKPALKNLIEHINSQISLLQIKGRNSETLSISQLMYTHSKSSIIFLSVASGYEDLLEAALQAFGYLPFFYNDEKYDPFKSALKLNSQKILDVFADYFSENLNVFVAMFTQNIFKEMLMSSSVKAQELAKSCFFSKGRSSDIRIPPYYPINKNEGYVTINHDKSERDLDFRNKLAKKSRENAVSKIEFLTVPLPINFKLSSDFSTGYLNMMENVPDHLLMSELKMFVREIWKRNIHYLWIYNILAWSYTLITCYDVIFEPNSSYINIPWVTLLVILFYFELAVMRADVKKYFLSFYNWLDLSQYLIFPLVIFYLDELNVSNNVKFSSKTYLLIAACIKSFSLLQIFDSVRYLIAMMFEVFRDLLAFALIFLSSLIVFALVEINADKTIRPTILEKYNTEIFSALGSDPNADISGFQVTDDKYFDKTLTSFQKKIDYSYGVSFGDWEDYSESNWVRYLIHFIGSVFLGLVMINLIIAMITLTFENFQETRDVVDTKLMIDILLEHNKFLRNYFGKRKSDEKSEEEIGFTHVLRLRSDEDESLSGLIEKFRSKKQEKMEEFEKKLKSGVSRVKKRWSEVNLKYAKFKRNFSEILKSRSEKKKDKN